MTFLLKSIKEKKGLRRYIGPKRVALLVLLTLFVLWAWIYYKSGALSPAIIEHYRSDYPLGSVLLFVAVYAIVVIAALPSLPLNLAAGFFWGGVVGGIYSTIGVTIGGWVSFVAARWLIGQPLAYQFESKWAKRVQEEFERNGWKFVAFARINPIIPTGPLNYLLGLTSLTNRGFLWATFIFLLPPSIAVAYIGDTLQTFTANQADVNEIIHGLLITSAAVTFLALAKFFSNIYKRRSENNENHTLGDDPQ
ncbi:putative membrane protein YdjX (TVP38/TMEM64 family) [Pseudomonas sp. TE3786]